MPEDQSKFTSEEIEEQRNLLDRMARSRVFEGKVARFKLLEFLFRKALADVRLSDYEIVNQHLRRAPSGSQESSRDGLTYETDNAKVRQLCNQLRKSLVEFSMSDVAKGQWRFVLPTTPGRGYKLDIINLNGEMGSVGRFWAQHVACSRQGLFVYNEPLFYRDEYAGTVVRMAQFEAADEANLGTATKIARSLSGGAEVALQPCHLYTLAGEIGARDRILDWFAEEFGMRFEKKASRMMRDRSDLADVTPIIVGNNRNNKIMKAVTELHQFGRFRYFVEKTRFRTVEITKYTQEEKQILAVTDKGYRFEDDGENLLLIDDPSPDKVVFCVVTRLPNPYDKFVPITMLSASYSKVLEAVAQTLTTETLWTEQLENQEIRPDRAFPRYFQGLFSVRLGATGADDRPHRPVLRCCRFFEDFRENPQDE